MMTDVQIQALKTDVEAARNYIRQLKNLDLYTTILRPNLRKKLDEVDESLEDREVFVDQLNSEFSD